MTVAAKHWRRPLKDGGIEFYFRSPTGGTMQGRVTPAGDLAALQEAFEQSTGCQLPPPETKPPRGAWS